MSKPNAQAQLSRSGLASASASAAITSSSTSTISTALAANDSHHIANNDSGDSSRPEIKHKLTHPYRASGANQPINSSRQTLVDQGYDSLHSTPGKHHQSSSITNSASTDDADIDFDIGNINNYDATTTTATQAAAKTAPTTLIDNTTNKATNNNNNTSNSRGASVTTRGDSADHPRAAGDAGVQGVVVGGGGGGCGGGGGGGDVDVDGGDGGRESNDNGGASNYTNNQNKQNNYQQVDVLRREFFNSTYTTKKIISSSSHFYTTNVKNVSSAGSLASSSPTNVLGHNGGEKPLSVSVIHNIATKDQQQHKQHQQHHHQQQQYESKDLAYSSSNNYGNLITRQHQRSSCVKQTTPSSTTADNTTTTTNNNNNNNIVSNNCSADNSDDIATLDDFEEEYEDDTERTNCSCNIRDKKSTKTRSNRQTGAWNNSICTHCQRQRQQQKNNSKLITFWRCLSSWPTSVVARRKSDLSRDQPSKGDGDDVCKKHGSLTCDCIGFSPGHTSQGTKKRQHQKRKSKGGAQNKSSTSSSSDEEQLYVRRNSQNKTNYMISNLESDSARKLSAGSDSPLQKNIDSQSVINIYPQGSISKEMGQIISSQQRDKAGKTANPVDLSRINEESEIEREIEFHRRYARNRDRSTISDNAQCIDEMNLKEVKILDQNLHSNNCYRNSDPNHCGIATNETHNRVSQNLKIVACSDGQFKQIILTNSAQKVRNLKSPDVSSLNSTINSCAMSKSTSEIRLRWGKKMDFLLSIIGFAVDLANIWRFPYLCYKNGGGVFLIPYITMLIFGGIPLFFLELLLGQYVKKGPITVWNKICPSMKGVGYCSILISWYVSFYYNVLIAWSVYFIYRSAISTSKMPWEECNHEWNSNATCMSIRQLRDTCSLRNETLEACKADIFATRNVTSPASEFFVSELLELDKSTGLEDMGYLRPELVVCTMVVYLLHYFSLFRGLETSGKVVWVTATAPYMILTILLVRGLFLPGASMGIAYYLSPKLEKLADPQVWVDAAGQVFYSIGVGFGVHLTYASFNSHNNNCYRDCLVTSAVNAATSVYSGLVVFIYLGYMATNLGIEIDKVASEGYSLVFEVYPEALTTLPFAQFWSILFFIMLLTLGIDSAMGGLEAVITGLEDEFKIARRLTRGQLTAIVILSSFFPALISCTQGGAYTMYWFDVYSAGVSLLFSALFEAIGVVYCYGLEKFIPNVESMLGRKPHLFYIICWKYISPLFLGVVIVMSIFSATTPTYRGYTFPLWSVIAGWALAFSSVSAIPIVAGIEWMKFWRGSTLPPPNRTKNKMFGIDTSKGKHEKTTYTTRAREQML